MTDHGTKNAEDPANNWITLWGDQESLSVTELRELFARLDPHVRVVVLMSQCYSGAFANLMYRSAAEPTGWQHVRVLCLDCRSPGIWLLSREPGQGQRRPLVCLY